MANNIKAAEAVTKIIDTPAVVRNELDTTKVEKGYMTQNNLTDKFDNNISEFMTVGNIASSQATWMIKDSYINMLDALGDKSTVNYTLKERTIGIGDKKSKDGKAIKLDLSPDTVKFSVYMKFVHNKEDKWTYDHEYLIPRKFFDAYTAVLKNEVAVEKQLKAQKNKEKTSLILE